MKPQDFMEALGGVSQEKLDALAEWQEAGTPVTGEAPARENRITRTAAEPVPTHRGRGNMKQNTRKKASVPRLSPWNIGIGAAVVTCAVIVVSIGKEAIGQERQMQVGSNAGTSMSEQIAESIADEVKNEEDSHLSLPDECTEVQAISTDAAEKPQYVKLMQEYYTQKSGIPCDYDFSSMGKDLDETIETDNARIHIKGMVGCDWTMFVFFDVEPLNLSAEETEYFSIESFEGLSDNYYPVFGIVGAEGKAVDFFQRICRTMPAQQSLDNGVFHCYCLISSHSEEAFTDGEKYLGIGKMNEPNDPEYDIRIPLDCLQTIPLQESELAAAVSTFIPDDSIYRYPPDKSMTRSAVTPFGVYCISDRYETVQKTGWGQSCYWLEISEYNLKATPRISQNDADGICIGTFGLDGQTSWGSCMKEGTGISFTDFLFDHPYDAAKGTLNVD